MRIIYTASTTETAVIARENGTGPGTYAVRPGQFPLDAFTVAQLMNQARLMGYQEAQRDMRVSLGIES